MKEFWKYFITVIATTVVIVGAYFAYNRWIAPLPPSTTKPAPPAPAKAVEAPKKVSEKVMELRGKGKKNTETFHISSNKWEIHWACRHLSPGGSALLVSVYKADGTLVETPVTVTGEDFNSTVMRTGPGDYYLKIESANMFYQIALFNGTRFEEVKP